MRALLDVNVLIALLDASHVTHSAAMTWLSDNVQKGWASCSITQNGCVRILSSPSYPNARPIAEVAERLREAVSTSAHEFWPDDISSLDAACIDVSRLHGARQLTDAYLLALAVRNNGRFVTFDRTVPVSAVVGAQAENLVVL